MARCGEKECRGKGVGQKEGWQSVVLESGLREC